jgi:glycosyltransferase involved in cell wall biosynthesis
MKISVIMQSYLDDYPGSRTNPEKKFLRAVESFLNQTNKNTELIIVSDGCKISEKIYLENWLDNDRVLFIYVQKLSPTMYSEENGKKFYRGTPRQTGRGIATGEITTYMDSDDFLIPEYLEILLKYWESNKNLDWLMNQGWYDNIEMCKNPIEGYYMLFNDQVIEEAISIRGLGSKWMASKLREKNIIMSPALTSHKSNCKTEWKDISDGNSEDKDFNKRLREDYYTTGGLFYYPGYVRCHLRDKWDW